MASLLNQTIEQISREKHIEPSVIVAAIEDAMVVAARKYYKTEEDLRGRYNPESGQVDVFAVRQIVEQVVDPLKEMSVEEARKKDPAAELGGELLMPKPTELLGRIAAQTAKQVILQKVREAERDTIFNEFNGRVGELVNCIVKRVEGPEVIVELGRTEARMPRREQSRAETYNVGDRLRVVIRAVERAGRGPQVVVSRADPVLVQRLFEMEVPEIYDGTVRIRAAAREAGERTKIAVESRDKDVDPVGACVGMKGMRVQSIIRELRGEKIDIIPFSEDIVTFALKSLSPAKVSRVQIIDPEEKRLEVIVEDTQLSLAIGKKGQNVRLASKLIGWNIDIKSEEEKRREIEIQMTALTTPVTPLEELAGVGPKTVERLQEHGISAIERLADMTPEQLMEIPGIGEKMVEKIRAAVANYFEMLEAGAAPAAQPQVGAAETAEAETAEAETAEAETAEAETIEAETAEAETAQAETAEGEAAEAETVAPAPAEEPAVAAETEPASEAETESATAAASDPAVDETAANQAAAASDRDSESGEAPGSFEEEKV